MGRRLQIDTAPFWGDGNLKFNIVDCCITTHSLETIDYCAKVNGFDGREVTLHKPGERYRCLSWTLNCEFLLYDPGDLV